MDAVIRWDDAERTILVVRYQEQPEAEEVIETMEMSARFLDSVDHAVSVIVDMSVGQAVFEDWTAQQPQLVASRGITHPNIAESIFVVKNFTIESMVSVFARIYHNVFVVHTMDEAYRLVRAQAGPPEEMARIA